VLTDGARSSAAPDFAGVIQAYRESIPKLMAEKKVPGLSVAVVTDGEVLWQEGFGYTDDDGLIPVSSETLFSIQSMSKNFTAAAVLAAVREGLVDLDAPITKYIPDFTVGSRFEEHPERKMTLRLLLGHRAGFTHEAPDGGNYDLGSGSFENHIRSISRTWLRSPVDERYCYSNLGIDLAGYILQVRSGMPFAEFVRRKILDPIGLTAGTFDMEAIKRNPKRAIGHNADRAPIPVEIPMVPAGGVYAGAAELARYVQFHLNAGRVGGRSILPESLLKEMSVIPSRNPRQTTGYGLGLAVGRKDGAVLLNHGGGGFGFLTYMGWIPDRKIGIVLLTNATNHNLMPSLPLEILDKFIGAGAGKKVSEAPPKTAETSLPSSIDVPAADQEKLAGRYLYASGGIMILEYENGRVGIKPGTEFLPAQFTSPAEAYFLMGGSPLYCRFVRNADGSPRRLIRLSDGETLYFNEGPSLAPGPDKLEWESLIGRYVYKVFGRPGGSFTVSRKNGYLYLDYMRLSEEKPGLFFSAHGEVLDFSGPIPTWRNIKMEKT
jgi:CubicO group peptidase (beta-lactamase class C family)